MLSHYVLYHLRTRMPHYFFDTSENGVVASDDDGLELRDDDAARDEAIRVLPGLAADRLPDGPAHVFETQVRNEAGRYIFAATLELRTAWLDGRF